MPIAGSVEPGTELCTWGHVESPGSPLGVSCLRAAALVLPSYLCWLLSLLLLGGLLASAPHGPFRENPCGSANHSSTLFGLIFWAKLPHRTAPQPTICCSQVRCPHQPCQPRQTVAPGAKSPPHSICETSGTLFPRFPQGATLGG